MSIKPETWNHRLVLAGVNLVHPADARFEVFSIQGDHIVSVQGIKLGYFPQYHKPVLGYPFGAYLRADKTIIMAPDWSEEIANGLENRTVLGEGGV